MNENEQINEWKIEWIEKNGWENEGMTVRLINTQTIDRQTYIYI